MTAGRPRTKSTDTHKICTKCKQTKLHEEFYSRRVSYCKTCSKIDGRARYAAKGRKVYLQTREEKLAKSSAYSRLVKYGLTPEAFDELKRSTGQICQGCGRHEQEFNSKWHIDHCHTTGMVRGMLCWSCNLTLGFARDSVETLEGLISYLKVAS